MVISRSGGRRIERLAVLGRRVAGAHRHRRLRGTARRAARRRARCPPAARAGSSRRRRPGPAAARCRGPGCAALGVGRRRGDEPVDRRTGTRSSVLPLPVGRADQRVLAADDRRPALRPAAGVGSGNDAANHSRTAGENPSSTGWSAMSASLRRGCHRLPEAERVEGALTDSNSRAQASTRRSGHDIRQTRRLRCPTASTSDHGSAPRSSCSGRRPRPTSSPWPPRAPARPRSPWPAPRRVGRRRRPGSATAGDRRRPHQPPEAAVGAGRPPPRPGARPRMVAGRRARRRRPRPRHDLPARRHRRHRQASGAQGRRRPCARGKTAGLPAART